ncbi:MAG: hypothetical protein L0323_22475 [Planctomycetes bacterium]|nr:hypothetical protein [Planctomycetota bacterium]
MRLPSTILLATSATVGNQVATDLLDRLALSADASTTADLAAELDGRLRARAEDPDAARLLLELARAWRRSGRIEEGVKALDRLPRRADDGVSVGDAYVEFAQALTLSPAPDLDAILRLYDQAAVAYPEDRDGWSFAINHPVNAGVRAIAAQFEGRGEWQKAADAWRRWRPVSWCGNAGETMREERLTRIARCLHLAGKSEEAISTLEEYLLGERFLNGPFPSPVFAYLEISARAGAFEQAKRKLLASPANRKGMGTLAWEPVEPQPQEPAEGIWFEKEIQIVEGFARGDPAAIVDALRGWDPLRMYDFERGFPVVPEEYVVAGRLLAELGRAGLDYLRLRIAEFDPVAWKLAGFTGHRELREPLDARLQEEEDPTARALIRDAIERLGAGRPASVGR